MSKSPNRLLARVFGAGYLLVGLIGFTATSGVGFFDTTGGLLLGIFEVNVFHNVAHLLLGAALLIAGQSNARAAQTVNTVIGAAYLLLGIIGPFILGSSTNILAMNGADNALHFGSGVILLGVGLGADRARRAARA